MRPFGMLFTIVAWHHQQGRHCNAGHIIGNVDDIAELRQGGTGVADPLRKSASVQAAK